MEQIDEPEKPSCDWRHEDGELIDSGHDVRSVKAVDLTGTPPSDLIGSLGACGSWGDCLYVVLKACEEGGYVPVWGPEYAQGIDVGERPEGADLANLTRHGRTASAGCDLPLETTLVWTGDGWEQHETCAGEGVWDESCGSRPPACD